MFSTVLREEEEREEGRVEESRDDCGTVQQKQLGQHIRFNEPRRVYEEDTKLQTVTEESECHELENEIEKLKQTCKDLEAVNTKLRAEKDTALQQKAKASKIFNVCKEEKKHQHEVEYNGLEAEIIKLKAEKENKDKLLDEKRKKLQTVKEDNIKLTIERGQVLQEKECAL